MFTRDAAAPLRGLPASTGSERVDTTRETATPFQGTSASGDTDVRTFLAQRFESGEVVTPEPSTPIPPDDEVPEETDPAEPEAPEPDLPEPAPLPPAGPLEALSLNWTAEAGRVVNLAPLEGEMGAISQIKILSQGSHGHVSANPDHSLSLVLSRDPGQTDTLRFEYEITYDDGRTQEAVAEVKVTPASQKGGWGQGNFYMLEEAADGRIVVEHGDNHRKIHITGSSDGLTRDDIAKAEGLPAGKITSKWLAEHAEYGATPEKALSAGLGMELWSDLTAARSGPSSHWLLFERGHEYAGTGRLIARGAEGESELHPIFVGAYGEGDAPQIMDEPNLYQGTAQNIVIQDLEFNGGFQTLTAANLLLNEVTLTGATGMNVQNVDGFTFRNSSIIDVARDTPVNDEETWHPSLNRAGGAFIRNTDGLLIENTLTDRNGWAEGYDYNLSVDAPMPPSMYSHNYYLQRDNMDVTFRDNIVMRGASFGAQFRPGGVIEGNVFIDNNAAVNALDGGEGALGNFTLMMNNIITSAGHKRVAQKEGALSMGIEAKGQQSSLVGNIVAHLADPNNPEELAQKTIAHSAHNVSNAAYDDTIVFNWLSSETGNRRNPDTNVDGLDRDTLNATTIQNFTAEILGRETASISDLADLLRAQASGKLDHVVDADLIVAFFQQGFGLEVDARSLGAMLRFQPSEFGDGMRWDNRLNWSTGDLPGTGGVDSVDLGGNSVIFGAKTLTVDDFIFGDFGSLTATSGRLNIAGDIEASGTGARLAIERAGQVWIDGYSDEDLLEVSLTGGRFANTGDMSGHMSLTSGGNSQALLATSGGSFDLFAGNSLTIRGAEAKIGFDGATDDTAVLRMHDGGITNFRASKEGLGQISEFRSGAFGETSQVTSGIRLDGALNIDLGGLDSKAGGDWTLIQADQIVGLFDDLTVTGLGKDQDALLRVDYVRDEVSLILGQQGRGSGETRMVTAGDESFISYTEDAALQALWDALYLPVSADF